MSIARSRVRLWALAVVAIVSVVAAVLAVVALRNLRAAPPAPLAPVRATLHLPDDLTLGAGPDYPFGLSLGPDGRRLVFPAARTGPAQLWIHDLSSGSTEPLPGTEGGVLPFWAPDGGAIAFFANGRLRAITLEDAVVRDLAEAPSPRGGAWHPGGDIIFAAQADNGLLRRRGSDGQVEPFTTLDAATGELSHRHPAIVDGGRGVIFFVRASDTLRQGLWLAAFDAQHTAASADGSTPAGATRKRLVGSESHAVVVDEAIVYSVDGALVAQRFDAAAQAVTGSTILLGTPVGRGPQNQLFATAGGDLLLYGAPTSALRELRWFDRSGASPGVVGEPMEAWDVRLAPFGATVAVTRADPQLGTLDIWTYDGERPLPRRISPSIDVDESPVWGPDASRLAWITARRTVVVRGAMAALPEVPLRKFEHPARLTDWSADGRWLVVNESRPGTRDDLWILSPLGAGDPRPYVQTPFSEIQGRVSPNGRWLAYASDETGQFEIYVDSFPETGQRARLTTGGGSDPRWHAEGGEIYFRRGSEIHVVKPFNAAGDPEAVSSERLFDAATDIRAYDADGEGQRFLLNVPAASTSPQRTTVLVNVRSLLRFAP